MITRGKGTWWPRFLGARKWVALLLTRTKTSLAAMATVATRALVALRTLVFSTFLYQTPVQYR